MSVASILSKVRRLQKIKAERLGLATSGTRKTDSRDAARLAAAESGRAAPLFPEYANDPLAFCIVVLGLRLCRAQRRILQAIARGKRVAIRSGQKTGKSTVLVAAALWWACTRARGRVLLTAPTNQQVRDVLWKELRRIVFARRPDGQRPVDLIGVTPAVLPSTGMQWPDGREIIGKSADDPNATQGLSSPELLVVVDEGSGVPDDIFEAHEGNTAAGGSILAAGNPVENVGWFFEAFHSQAEYWDTIHLSSEDTPNCTGEEEPIPGLADPIFVAEQKKKYGETSAYYLQRIKGEFAGTSTTTVVATEAVAAAKKRWTSNASTPRTEPLVIGLDVARFGDDSSMIAPRRGPRIYPLVGIQGSDGNGVAGEVLRVVRELRLGPSEIVTVNVDGTGGYGASPADILRAQHSDEVTVVEINSSEKADDAEKYANLRAQLHFGVAEWLAEGGELPDDKKLEVELIAAKYRFDARRRFLIERKDEIKKRIRRSPDRADAVALAIYVGRIVTDAAHGSASTEYDFETQGIGGI